GRIGMTASLALERENPHLSEMNRLSILNLRSICRSALLFVYSLFLTPVIAGPRTHASGMNQTEGDSGVSRKGGAVETVAPDSGPRDSKSAEGPSAPEGGGDSAADLGKRTELNLLGKTDVAGGESRRNENVQFNLIDNNALKELNIRLGTTATLIEDFQPNRGYFGAEFGNSPTVPLHLLSSNHRNFHGRLYESHMNSVFSARSFFQVGDVKPARDNDYGFALGIPLSRSSKLFMQGSQQKLHGNVNGNVLVPRADERLPLATDPATRAIV